MDKDKLTGLIKDIINEEIARLIAFCKTQPPAAHIAAMQAVNVKCDPPDEWGELVYNGELCKTVRADPTLADFKCDACYACCVKDVTQNAIITISGDCNIGRDALAAAIASLKSTLMFRLPRRTERDVMNIDLLSTSVALDNIPAALQKVVLLQRVNVSGVGAVNAIKQSIVTDLLFRSVVSATTKTAIDTYVKEFLAYVPPAANANLPAPIISPALVNLIPNSITDAANKADEDARLIQSAGGVGGGSGANNVGGGDDPTTKKGEVGGGGGGGNSAPKTNTAVIPDATTAENTDVTADTPVNPNISKTDAKELSSGAIAGIVIGVFALIVIIVLIIRFKLRTNRGVTKYATIGSDVI